MDGEETNFAGDYWMSAPVLWVNAQKQTQRGRKTGIKSVKLTKQRKEISSGEVLSISSRFGGGFADHPYAIDGIAKKVFYDLPACLLGTQ